MTAPVPPSPVSPKSGDSPLVPKGGFSNFDSDRIVEYRKSIDPDVEARANAAIYRTFGAVSAQERVDEQAALAQARQNGGAARKRLPF